MLMANRTNASSQTCSWLVLILFHQFSNDTAAFELFTCCFVKVAGELSEGSKLTILSKSQTNTAAEFLNDLSLSCTTDSRNRDTRVDSGTDTGIEKVGFKKIWPSVIEITLVGTKAVTSPACVSMIGRAVIEPVLPLTAPLVKRSTYSGFHERLFRADGCGGRKRRQGRLHVQADDEAAGRSDDKPRPVLSSHHRR